MKFIDANTIHTFLVRFIQASPDLKRFHIHRALHSGKISFRVWQIGFLDMKRVLNISLIDLSARRSCT